MVKRKFFSLIELMVVIAIIGFLAGIMVLGYEKIFGDAGVEATTATIQQIESALRIYKVKEKKYPTTDEGLGALVDKGYLDKYPLDAWENEIQYQYPGTGNRRCDVFSYGEDGLDGGEGINADIYNGH